mmetsp:Transcript_13808/g.22875  ORF Transcript_13808/g.22875 Transcript_13808/m.22875 type:complete len:193 (-) Transcript_13808:214-792(-)
MTHETMDDFWKFVLNENEEDSCQGKRRWFSRKKLPASEGDSYSDQRDDYGEHYTESLENKIERAFDSVFYEEPIKKEKPRRFNWFRQKNSAENEEGALGGMTIFAPSVPGSAAHQDIPTSNSWFSAGDEKSEMMQSQTSSKKGSIFGIETSDSSNSQKWFSAQDDRNDDTQQSRRVNKKSIFAPEAIASGRQ